MSSRSVSLGIPQNDLRRLKVEAANYSIVRGTKTRCLKMARPALITHTLRAWLCEAWQLELD